MEHYFELCRPKQIAGSLFLNTLGCVSDPRILGTLYNNFTNGDIGTPKNLLFRAAKEYEGNIKNPVRYHSRWVQLQRNVYKHKLYDLENTNIILLQKGKVLAILPGTTIVIRGYIFPYRVTGHRLLLIDSGDNI